jgi:formylglycine-generating enzyme required for sulfatase activity
VQQVPWESGSLTGKFCFGTCGDEGQRADLEQQLAELEQQRAEINRQRAQLEQQQLEQDQLRQQGLEFERQRALLELEQAKLRLQQAELEQQRAELEKQKAPDPTPPQQISQGEQINSEAIFNLERGMFETTQQYFARLNQAAQKGDRRYQAGVAYLKNYNADNETLFVSLKWQAEWVKEYLGTYSKFGIVKIAPGDAEALWKAGKNKPLFFTAELAENSQNITGGVLVEGGKAWTISISPIPEMVTIPAGRFQMGGTGDNEKPIHWVSLKSFSMSRYEITFDEYDYFAEATGRSKPSDKNWGRGKRPVIHVSWYDATAYAEWLSQVTGEQYRLPTEAEWEYAARGGTDTDYWWGNDVGSNNANCSNSYCKDRFEYTAPVGSFAPNPFGLYDTAGNVWEWTCSEYEGKYSGKEQRCLSQNIASNESRLSLRGGSWNNDVARVRSALRSDGSPTDRDDIVGLRVARLP